MRKHIVLHCKQCQIKTNMTIAADPVKHLGIYWVKCSKCKNNWRIPIKELERLAG